MWNPALLKKHHETGRVEYKPRSAQMKKLTKSDEKYLKVTSLIDRKKASRAFAAQLPQTSGHKCTYLRYEELSYGAVFIEELQ